jgi:hypothetical protein
MNWIDLAQDRDEWRKVLEYVRNWRLLKKDSAPQLFSYVTGSSAPPPRRIVELFQEAIE